MKKVHMGNNKSLINPASINKNVPSYGVQFVWYLNYPSSKLIRTCVMDKKRTIAPSSHLWSQQ